MNELKGLQDACEKARAEYRGALIILSERTKPDNSGNWPGIMSSAIQATAAMLPAKLAYDEALQRLHAAEEEASAKRTDDLQQSMKRATWVNIMLTVVIMLATIVSAFAALKSAESPAPPSYVQPPLDN